MIFEYGAMSSKYSVEADNKLTAYAVMVYHYERSAHLIMLYSPEEIVKDDVWADFTGKISARLGEIFIASSGQNFDQYVESHVEEFKAACKTIKQLV